MSRTRPAAASSTLDSNERSSTNTRNTPATARATKTTDADTMAERVEMPQLDGRVKRKARLGCASAAFAVWVASPMMVDFRRLSSGASASCRLIDAAVIQEV